MGDSKNRSTTTFITTMAVVVMLVLLTSGVIALKSSAAKKVADTTTQVNSAQTSTESAKVSSSPYKDGTYVATGSYNTPGGLAKIGITLTLKDGVVTDTAAQLLATNNESAEHQAAFIDGYKSQVIGKSIASLKLGKISHSSLTPKGFNNAVEQIKSQSQA